MKDEISFFRFLYKLYLFMINMEIDTVLYGNQILFLKSENTSFTGRDSLFFAWCSAVLGRGATFLLMKDPAEIQGVVVSDNACNLIDGVSCIF